VLTLSGCEEGCHIVIKWGHIALLRGTDSVPRSWDGPVRERHSQHIVKKGVARLKQVPSLSVATFSNRVGTTEHTNFVPNWKETWEDFSLLAEVSLTTHNPERMLK